MDLCFVKMVCWDNDSSTEEKVSLETSSRQKWIALQMWIKDLVLILGEKGHSKSSMNEEVRVNFAEVELLWSLLTSTLAAYLTRMQP